MKKDWLKRAIDILPISRKDLADKAKVHEYTVYAAKSNKFKCDKLNKIVVEELKETRNKIDDLLEEE